MWSQSPLFFPPSFFSPGPCVISGQASDYSCDYCAAVCLRSVEAPRVLPARLCAGSQPVRQLSRSDLWPLDSNLSSLPARYCCNWQLMRPDMLSSRALNRTSIFPRHWALVFFLFFLHSPSHSIRLFLRALLALHLFFRGGISDSLWKGLLKEMFLRRGWGEKSIFSTHTHSLKCCQWKSPNAQFNLIINSFQQTSRQSRGNTSVLDKREDWWCTKVCSSFIWRGNC